MKTVFHETDLCVVGGGMAGVLCAIAVARKGIRVVLMYNRPVSGGNALTIICGGSSRAARMIASMTPKR